MEWVRGDILGHGSFGTVSLAKPGSSRSSCHNIPELMAVKSCGVSSSASLLNEKEVLDGFKDCPEIIQCYGDGHSFENGEKLYNVFLEYASGGTLADKLNNSCDHRLPEDEVRRYTRGVLRGLRRVHENGFVHCDIKLQNILLGQDGAVKIGDFGLAKKDAAEKVGCELRGTPLYMSPEMVAGGDQSSPADIWALGCLVAEMFTGVPAWRCSDVAALLMRIGVGDEVPEIPGKLSEEGKDFVGKCFVKDPKERWTAEMLLDHPFVCDHDDRGTVTFKEVPSTSPRSAFDFPDWVSQQSSLTFSITSLSSPESQSWVDGPELNTFDGSWSNSPAKRLQGLVNDHQLECFGSDDWITVR
ncbi:unnamed protein product [Coffea canephora]|uniref:Protein kinase domain-containing protein n=2 Tax=Coffea TaxID=13442 RepID=A0A068U4G4_COFCA|nr:mitogen-activated protein kinase kinase kinase 17-like [Coffea arabica]CDP02503.1 unnamed protein product [Coffea canephora]